MKVELVIQKNKELPAGAVAAIEQEFQKRLLKSYPDCRVAVRLGARDNLSVLGAEKGAKERVENILQETGKARTTGFIDGTLCRQITQQRRLR